MRILLKNRKAIEDKIRDLGAKVIHRTKVVDRYYCPNKVKNFYKATIDQIGYAFRIRRLEDLNSKKRCAWLECKTLVDKKNHAICNEYEIELSDTANMEKVLAGIGFKNFLLIDKERVTYKFKKYKFVFENIKGLGQGLEIEILTNKDYHKKYEQIKALSLSLGITKKEILKQSLTYLMGQKYSKF